MQSNIFSHVHCSNKKNNNDFVKHGVWLTKEKIEEMCPQKEYKRDYDKDMQTYEIIIGTMEGTIEVLKTRHADLKRYTSLLVNEIKDFMNGSNNKEQVEACLRYLEIYIGE